MRSAAEPMHLPGLPAEQLVDLHAVAIVTGKGLPAANSNAL